MLYSREDGWGLKRRHEMIRTLDQRDGWTARLANARGVALVLLALALDGCATLGSARRVDVGGYRLRLECSGHGSPIVVMDAGLGDTLETWDEVAPKVAKFTRVCVYDRAGLGRSDPGPMPRTSGQIAAELYRMIKTAGLPPPYILVGHSLGGLNVSLFASMHPDEVAGLVLVDSTHEDYPARERALRSAEEKSRIENAFGIASPAARSEYQSMPASVEQIKAARPLPDVPVIVLTAGHMEGSAALRELWLTLQADLANRASHGTQVIAQESGHFIQFDRPDLVIDAIQKVVEGAKMAAPGRNAPASYFGDAAEE